jgi:hypothetical protein
MDRILSNGHSSTGLSQRVKEEPGQTRRQGLSGRRSLSRSFFLVHEQVCCVAVSNVCKGTGLRSMALFSVSPCSRSRKNVAHKYVVSEKVCETFWQASSEVSSRRHARASSNMGEQVKNPLRMASQSGWKTGLPPLTFLQIHREIL